jgi:hypothetical protein
MPVDIPTAEAAPMPEMTVEIPAAEIPAA